MILLGFKLNGTEYKSIFKKDGRNFVANYKNGNVMLSEQIGLSLTLPLKIDVEEVWLLKDSK